MIAHVIMYEMILSKQDKNLEKQHHKKYDKAIGFPDSMLSTCF